ncbi:ABC transporter [Lachnoclostridium sp. An169]|uniref:ABC transporter ATP-binding protein n=1 Tax=Lachnoclostridium sp. An169 TaxID=1965569 RepID=UPI000B398E75|nr:ABC transporter ATP-binding protein [Lachnoclostridium sp. An169]OUP84217.1 ABC transporter [Lachnoclostridium sp. An169]HJA64704.1 ABC transporter ATP-binding protein [Candidatus Mediterraneibacter cottocaccae]
MYAVEVRNLTKKFGKRVIFEQEDLQIEEGKLTAITGPSGCGKSTLLNIIGALEDYDGGSIRIFGREVPKPGSRKATLLRRNTVNYLFQSFALVSDMTVCENLLLAMHFVGISRREKEKRISRVLESVGLGKMKNAVVNTLSGGEQQRVALARTLLKPGKLLLADEPTGALDEAAAYQAFSLLKELCRQYRKTVVMVTHSRELASMADRVIELA